jgi:hypothetical protein
MGKALFLVIGIAGFLGSCRSDDNMANRYLFHEVAGTKNLKYNAGEIEGVIFQDEIKSNGQAEKYVLFKEKNLEILQKYLNTLDEIINAWFSEDRNNPNLFGFFNNERFNSLRNEYIERKGEKNINKYKRLYSFKMDIHGNGRIICEVFYPDSGMNWMESFPAFDFGMREIAMGFMFWFVVNENKIALQEIMPE